MGDKKGIKGIGDFFTQSSYDIEKIKMPGSMATTSRLIKNKVPAFGKHGALEEPAKREERQATEDAAKAKVAARQAIKPIPDPEAGKTEARKQAGKRRMKRKGRASTVLSGDSETLG
jgi:hypothetical protein